MCCLDSNLTIKTWVVLDESFNLLVSGQKATWGTILVGQVSDSSLVPCLWGEWRTPRCAPYHCPCRQDSSGKRQLKAEFAVTCPVRQCPRAALPGRVTWRLLQPWESGNEVWGGERGSLIPLHAPPCSTVYHLVSSSAKMPLLLFFL